MKIKFRIDMGIDHREEIINEQQTNVIFVHYSGKLWTVRGAVNNNSKYFQEIFRDLFKENILSYLIIKKCSQRFSKVIYE